MNVLRQEVEVTERFKIIYWSVAEVQATGFPKKRRPFLKIENFPGILDVMIGLVK